MLAVPLVMKSRVGLIAIAPVDEITALPLMNVSRIDATVIAALLAILVESVMSWKPLSVIVPIVAPSCVKVDELSVRFGRVPLMPDRSVSAPVPVEMLPLSVKLPVPAVEPPAACKFKPPVAVDTTLPPALMVKSRGVVMARV